MLSAKYSGISRIFQNILNRKKTEMKADESRNSFLVRDLLAAMGYPLLLLVLAGCAGTAENSDPAVGAMVIPVRASQPQPFAEFNERVAEAVRRGETWPHQPVLVAWQFAGWEETSAGVIAWHGAGERPVQFRLAVISDGLLDDSVRGQRLEMVLDRQPDNSWRVVDARMSWRCWRKGGDDSFGAELCP